MEPYWSLRDVRIYHGSVLDVLPELPRRSFHSAITSPPYWGLREYGEGNADELGSEKTPEEYVERMVDVGRCVRRVLRDDGTFWLNLGDTYASGGGHTTYGPNAVCGPKNRDARKEVGKKNRSGLPNGNLVGIPWRVAFALQADGWILRQDVIWHKPSPMPAPVKNRCVTAHEYLFLFAKNTDYYFDHVAIQEPAVQADRKRKDQIGGNKSLVTAHSPGSVFEGSAVSNKRDVWTVAAQGTSLKHYAPFPPKLILPCVLAGTSEHGCCDVCGGPYRRVYEEEEVTRERPNDYVKRVGEQGTGNSCANSVAGVRTKTLGWRPTCSCKAGVRPCTILDMFMGSGTTASVCRQFGRACVGVELYDKNIVESIRPRVEGTPPGVGFRADVKPRVKKSEGGFFD